MNHPYFKKWCDFLNIPFDHDNDDHDDNESVDNSVHDDNYNNESVDNSVHDSNENTKNPCDSKVEASENNSYLLRTEKNYKLLNNQLNVKRSPYVKYVPKFLQHFSAFLGKTIKDIYFRVRMAAKKAKFTDNENIQNVAFSVMEYLKKHIKNGAPLQPRICVNTHIKQR